MSDPSNIIIGEKASSELMEKAKPQENPVASKKVPFSFAKFSLLFFLSHF